MADHGAGERGIKLALVSYSVLVVLQLVMYAFTGVLVLLAQALEMLSDVMISSFLLLSAYWSRKPADEFHMFGHGRAQNVAALVSAVILASFISVETLREAVPKFFESPKSIEMQNLSLVLIVILVGMVLVAAPLLGLSRARSGGASAKAQFVALLKDELSYVVALVGVVLVSRGFGWGDPFASAVIGGLIAYSGLYLFKENVHYLLGRAPGEDFLQQVRSTALSVKGVLGVENIRAEYVGPGAVHTGFQVRVARGTPIEEADRISHEVQQRVSSVTGCQHCVIHVHPSENGL